MKSSLIGLLVLTLCLFPSCASTRGTVDVTDSSARPVTYLLTLGVKDGQLDAFQAVMEDLVASTRNESGTLVYEWYLSDDKRTVQILERFEDTHAYLLHGEGFGPFAERFLATVDIHSLTVLGNPDEEARAGLSGLNPTYMHGIGGFRR